MIENYNEFKFFLTSLKDKPSLLLHVCCAPCSSHCLLLLEKYFDITIFYSNDNIYPEEEYNFRLNEVNEFVKKLDLKIKVINDEYHPFDYYETIKGLEHLGEKSNRCYNCYKLRLEKTAIKAKTLNFDYFTTSLSISPYKVEKWINEIGYDLERQYNVKYLYSNFKKEDGYKHSIKLSNDYGLYRQDYCGCEYSLKERREYIDRNPKEDQSKKIKSSY
ncbi:MAG: epoxyqueuosine reductase QueH [Anaeroplasma sp.]